MRTLADFGCQDGNLRNAFEMMYKGKVNTGICFSNKREGISVIVISVTTSAKEFLNSLVHETGHLACHISSAFGISTEGEEICYIMGNIAMQMYPKVRDLLCEHCREQK